MIADTLSPLVAFSGLLGLVWIAIGVVIFRLNFHWKATQQATKRDTVDEVGETLRTEKRSRRHNETADWDRAYQAALPPVPPPPPCTSTDHQHTELLTWGGVIVSRTCDLPDDWTNVAGRISALEYPKKDLT